MNPSAEPDLGAGAGPAFCGSKGCGPRGTRTAIEGLRWADGQPFVYRFCLDCEMGFVDPWPDERRVAALYGSDYTYYQDGVEQTVGAASRLKMWIAARRHRGLVTGGSYGPLSSFVAAIVERLAGKTITYSLGLPLQLHSSARILDYGCGVGDWLLMMKSRGNQGLYGYDVSANDRAGARLAGAGIAYLDNETLDAIEPGSFDLVRLEHVLEHLQDPLGDLCRIRQLLGPEGRLVMTLPSNYPWKELPDLALSPDLPHMQIPVHLAHHSAFSLRRLLEMAGFEVLGLKSTKRERFLTAVARPAREPLHV